MAPCIRTEARHKIHQLHRLCFMIYTIGRKPLIGGGPEVRALAIMQFPLSSWQHREPRGIICRQIIANRTRFTTGHPILISGESFCNIGGISATMILTLTFHMRNQHSPFCAGWEMPTIGTYTLYKHRIPNRCTVHSRRPIIQIAEDIRVQQCPTPRSPRIW